MKRIIPDRVFNDVCLLGHYIYIDNDNYYSFFDNDEDEVVCIWWLK